MKYDSSIGKYTTPSKNVEQIEATVTLKIHIKDDLLSYKVDIFPDSGASICVCGTDHLDMLGLSESELMACNNSIEAVGGSKLKCRGWIPVEFSVQGHTTIQPLYIP